MAGKNRAFKLLTAVLLATAALTGQANDRKYVYACEVMTRSGVAGLVWVQADTMDDASTAALKVEALTLGGDSSPAMSVVQCIQEPDGRFSDSQLQRFYENQPR